MGGFRYPCPRAIGDSPRATGARAAWLLGLIVDASAHATTWQLGRQKLHGLAGIGRRGWAAFEQNCGLHCVSCGQNARCATCEPGWGLEAPPESCAEDLACRNACAPCRAQNCHDCAALADGSCMRCNSGYHLKDGLCVLELHAIQYMSSSQNAQAQKRDVGLNVEARIEHSVQGGKNGRLSPWVVPITAISAMDGFGRTLAAVVSAILLVAVLLVAAGYRRMDWQRLDDMPRGQDGRSMRKLPRDGLSDHILACNASYSIGLWSLCCPCIRWSDTVALAGYMPFWMALSVWMLLLGANLIVLGSGAVLIVASGVFYRRRIRESFKLPKTTVSLLKDVVAWLFCCPCAIAQEARHVERGLEHIGCERLTYAEGFRAEQ